MDPQVVRTIYRQGGTGEQFDAGDMSFGVSYARFFTDKFSSGVDLGYYPRPRTVMIGANIRF